MEMGMRSVEDIEIGEDVTEEMEPLCWALHHHIESPPADSSTSIVRAAIDLLRRPEASSSDGHRIAGLLTNRDKLLSAESDIDMISTIKDGARAMVAARTNIVGDNADESELELESSALCAVITNAVEVHDNHRTTPLGIAVYGPAFSWINHSCTPNACYHTSHDNHRTAASRIVPYIEIGGGVCGDAPQLASPKGTEGGLCGPRVRVRSIKRIENSDPITVAYTDLLQPKSLRQAELWSKYRFLCRCPRCSAVPPSYVDRVLEEISVVNSTNTFCKDEITEVLMAYVDDAIADYLSANDPRSCCQKLENLLTRGLLRSEFNNGGGSGPAYWLHPLHHLSLNAYIALSSAYKARANELLALVPETNDNLREAFELGKISSAYSLLLGGATDHLFRLEASLIVSAANYWVNAGESITMLVRSSSWRECMPVTSVSCVESYQCPKCSLRDRSGTSPFHGRVNEYADFENVSGEFRGCVADYARKVWCFLVRGSQHLRVFRDPFDFNCTLWGNNASSESGSDETCEDQVCEDHVRMNLFQLGSRCLLYGGYLARVCFGEHSYLSSHSESILQYEERLNNGHE